MRRGPQDLRVQQVAFAHEMQRHAAGHVDGLHHVETRSRQLAQPRPEYGHCTNAVAIVESALMPDELLQRVWGDTFGAGRDYVHVYINRLRRKLEIIDIVIAIAPGPSLRTANTSTVFCLTGSKDARV